MVNSQLRAFYVTEVCPLNGIQRGQCVVSTKWTPTARHGARRQAISAVYSANRRRVVADNIYASLCISDSCLLGVSRVTEVGLPSLRLFQFRTRFHVRLTTPEINSLGTHNETLVYGARIHKRSEDNLKTISDLRQSYDNWRFHRTFTTVLRPI